MKNQIGLAVAYDGRAPDYLAHVLPYVDYLEITPDAMAESKDGNHIIPSDIIKEFQTLQSHVQLIVHGVGLSIGSHDGYSMKYIELMDQLVRSVDIAWHSEHLGYTMVDGIFVGTMLTLPCNESVLLMLIKRIKEIQDRYKMPFLLENVASLIPPDKGTMDEAEFLNRICEHTECKILLDLYNLQCDAHNFGLNIETFISKLNLDRVVEIHVTGGVKHKGFLLDVHSRQNDFSTLKLLEETISRTPNLKTITYELLPEAVPLLGTDVIVEELKILSTFIGK
jgi:uncharacterized protein